MCHLQLSVWSLPLVLQSLLFSLHSPFCYSLFNSCNSVCTIFFDLHNPFNCIPHRHLLDSLSSTGLLPLLIHWLCNCLSNRLLQVVNNGHLSRPSLVLSRVPEGSILGLLLLLSTFNGLYNIPFLLLRS